MPFTADLNPKKSGSDVGDLLKMSEAVKRKKLIDDAMANQTGKAPIIVMPVNAKSSVDDEGVPFKFGNNYQQD